MTSHRKRKKEAAKAGLAPAELELLDLMSEMLERFRWLQILSHAQSYLLRQKLEVSDEELDKVLKASARSFDRDAGFQRWEQRFAAVKAQLLEGRRGIRRENKRNTRARKRGEAGEGGA
jgi:hypothetical protein